MSSRPSASMPTTRPCRCWPRAKPAPAGYGPMCATTGPLAVRSAGGCVLLFARSWRRASRAASGRLCRIDAGRRLCRVQPALRGRRKGGPIVEAACWAHARRKFFELAGSTGTDRQRGGSRIDALFAIEREINGLAPQQRVSVRNERSRPLVTALESWLREQRAKVSKNSETGKAIDYSLKRWAALTRFLDDGRLCMSNNAAERELRAIAVGRRNWTFAGSDEGGRRAAAIYTLIATAKLNDIDPQAWLADVLARMPDYPAKRIDDLLPWNWHAERRAAA